MNICRFFCSLLYCPLLFVTVACAGDWPTYQHDSARSGVTSEALGAPLYEKWVHVAGHDPRPAWPAPAQQDFWHRLTNLVPRVTYDRAFHPVVAGETLYFGSSADDHVYALDTETGEVRWTFQTEGPVRLAPTIADGKMYVGSDDGCVYCLAASDGQVVWKRRIAPYDRRIPGNGRVISMFPIRTGVLVDGGIAYCCAGLFPTQGVYRCALDAATGDVVWHERTDEFSSQGLSPQGYLLASADMLHVPTGRTSPAAFARRDGKSLGSFGGEGSAYTVLVGDTLVSGDNRKGDMLRMSGVKTRDTLLSFQGLRLLVDGDRAYMQTKTDISLLARARYTRLASQQRTTRERRDKLAKELEQLGKSAANDQRAKLKGDIETIDQRLVVLAKGVQDCIEWREGYPLPYSLVLAGDLLFAGGDNRVVAIGAADGVKRWEAEVDGKAYGMCVADGCLFVSTDQGVIHCFSPTNVERAHTVEKTRQPYPDDASTSAYVEAAEQIVQSMWPDAAVPRRGYCLVLDCGEGRLAYELAKRTELQILGVDSDMKNVESARRALAAAGLYGDRVAIHRQSSPSLPYGSFFANLVVSDRAIRTGELPSSAKEVVRLLRPDGGLAMIGQSRSVREHGTRLTPERLGQWVGPSNIGPSDASRPEAGPWAIESQDGLWAMLRRKPLPGGGEWTQLYANAGHTACSNDTIQGPMTLQWFGAPGPRRMIDRHHRPMSSLAKDGRVFVPADNAVIAVDAFNGARLWETDVPNSRRIGAMKNSGQMLIEGDDLYIAAEDKCWVLDAVTGQRTAVLITPKMNDAETRHWGYLNCAGDRLFGTGVKPTATFTKTWIGGANFLEGDFRPVVIGHSVFSVDRQTGETLWTYEEGAVMNSAIAIGQGRIYFVVSRNSRVVADDDGRVRIDDFCKGPTRLVALDLATGAMVWEQPVDFPHQHIMFLVATGDTVLVTGSYNENGKVYYGLDTFDGASGKPRWHNRFVATNIRGTEPTGQEGSHGEQWQHPVVVGDRVYLRPYGFDLATGKKTPYHLYRGGHGCGGLTGSANFLFGRGDNPRMYPLNIPSTQGMPLTRTTRPGCYLNIIPASGLVLIPESSSGCTCSYSMQTSLVFVPKSLSE